jgi:hypothetical protein
MQLAAMERVEPTEKIYNEELTRALFDVAKDPARTCADMKTLVEQGANPHYTNSKNYHSVLSNAVASHSPAKVRYLVVECGVRVDTFSRMMARTNLFHISQGLARAEDVEEIINILDTWKITQLSTQKSKVSPTGSTASSSDTPIQFDKVD